MFNLSVLGSPAFIPLPGPTEFLVILAIVLLIFGPKKVPEIGKAIGKTVKEFRKSSETEPDKEVPAKAPEKNED